MKKILFTMVAMLMTSTMTINAEEMQGDLYIPDIKVEEGTTSAALQLCLKNDVSGVTGLPGLEAHITMPDGFGVTTAARGSRLKKQYHDEEEGEDVYYWSKPSLTISDQVANILLYITEDFGDTPLIDGTDGEIVKINITIPEGASGTYTVDMETEVSNGTKIISTYRNTTFTITVGDPTGVKEISADNNDGTADGKYLKDGRLVIKKGGKMYSAVGATAK